MTAPADLASATVGQLLIPVTNLEQATAYYRDTLGIPFLFSAPPQMSFFQTGNVRLLVGVREDGATDLRSSMIYFRVEDIHSVHAGLASRGVTFGHLPHLVHRAATYELWLADFTDPDGNPLALMSEIPIVA
jgi:methylmalonyl-CoA/ethylmalonyl-CoA epimerase